MHRSKYQSRDFLNYDVEKVRWLELVRKRGQDLKNAPSKIRTDRDVVFEAVKSDLDAVGYAGSELLHDAAFMLECVKLGVGLSVLSVKLRRDRRFVLEAVRRYSGSSHRGGFEQALQLFGGDREIILEAVKKNGLFLRFATPGLRNEQQVVLEAVNNVRAGSFEVHALYTYVGKRIQHERAVVLAFVQKGLSFDKIPAQCKRDKEVLLGAARMGVDLERMPKELRADKDFVIEAVRARCMNLEFAAEELRDDKDVVMEAIKGSGSALKFASDRMCDDEDVVLTALCNTKPLLDFTLQRMALIKFASHRLRNDPYFILKSYFENHEKINAMPLYQDNARLTSNKEFMISIKKIDTGRWRRRGTEDESYQNFLICKQCEDYQEKLGGLLGDNEKMIEEREKAIEEKNTLVKENEELSKALQAKNEEVNLLTVLKTDLEKKIKELEGKHAASKEKDIMISLESILEGELMGSGTYGDVFSAQWIKGGVGIDIAYKRIIMIEPLDMTAILKELTFALQYDHPLVVNVYGFAQSEDKKTLLVIMEKMHSDLFNYIYGGNKKMSFLMKLELMKKMTECVHYIHAVGGIVHKSIKCKNFLVSVDGKRVCVSDFGMVLTRQLSESKQKGDQWKAPELFGQGKKMYSLGMAFYEILNGKHPFQEEIKNGDIALESIGDLVKSGKRPEFNQNVPQNCINLVENCWCSDPMKRKRTYEILSDISELVKDAIEKREACRAMFKSMKNAMENVRNPESSSENEETSTQVQTSVVVAEEPSSEDTTVDATQEHENGSVDDSSEVPSEVAVTEDQTGGSVDEESRSHQSAQFSPGCESTHDEPTKQMDVNNNAQTSDGTGNTTENDESPIYEIAPATENDESAIDEIAPAFIVNKSVNDAIAPPKENLENVPQKPNEENSGKVPGTSMSKGDNDQEGNGKDEGTTDENQETSSALEVNGSEANNQNETEGISNESTPDLPTN